METTLIKIVLPPNSMGRLGKIPKGEQSLPSKALNSIINGIRVGDPSFFQADEDIIHEDAPSFIIHR
jgi:hypothetical protein